MLSTYESYTSAHLGSIMNYNTQINNGKNHNIKERNTIIIYCNLPPIFLSVVFKTAPGHTPKYNNKAIKKHYKVCPGRLSIDKEKVQQDESHV